MGAVFSLPWARLSDWAGAPSLLRQSGFRTVALTLTADAVDLERVSAELGSAERVAILLRCRGRRLVGRVDPRCGAAREDPDVCRHRLAQCRGRVSDRLLRARPALRRYPRRDRPIARIAVGCFGMKEIELLSRPSGKPVAEDNAIQMISFVLEAAA